MMGEAGEGGEVRGGERLTFPSFTRIKYIFQFSHEGLRWRKRFSVLTNVATIQLRAESGGGGNGARCAADWNGKSGKREIKWPIHGAFVVSQGRLRLLLSLLLLYYLSLSLAMSSFTNECLLQRASPSKSVKGPKIPSKKVRPLQFQSSAKTIVTKGIHSPNFDPLSDISSLCPSHFRRQMALTLGG